MTGTILDRHLSDSGFRLLAVLRLLAAGQDSVQVTGTQLSTVMGKTEGAIWRAMKELRELGYVERDRAVKAGYRAGAQANLYTLRTDDWDHS